jgi:uroporphyrinogen-III synthase
VNAPLSLAGKRILTTRAPQQAGRLAQALEAKGARVLRLATIEIVPPASYAALDTALRGIQGFDWLILTSTNGVAALHARTQVLQLPRHRFAHLQVAAIGHATAEAAREIGLTVAVVPEKYVAEGVVASVKDKVASRRVLLVRASVGRDVIPDELVRCGARVEIAEAYRTHLPETSIGEVKALLGEGKPLPDAVTFTSSSTVSNFFALLRAAAMERPSGLRAVSIGPVTTNTLREHNWEPSGEAARSDIPGLVQACEGLLSWRR